jgi:hypothetical protein
MLRDPFTYTEADVKLVRELPITHEKFLSRMLMRLNDLYTSGIISRVQLHVS